MPERTCEVCAEPIRLTVSYTPRGFPVRWLSCGCSGERSPAPPEAMVDPERRDPILSRASLGRATHDALPTMRLSQIVYFAHPDYADAVREVVDPAIEVRAVAWMPPGITVRGQRPKEESDG